MRDISPMIFGGGIQNQIQQESLETIKKLYKKTISPIKESENDRRRIDEKSYGSHWLQVTS